MDVAACIAQVTSRPACAALRAEHVLAIKASQTSEEAAMGHDLSKASIWGDLGSGC